MMKLLQAARSPGLLIGGRLIGGRHPRGVVLLGLMLLTLLGLVLIGVVLIALAAVWYWPQLPSLDKVTAYQPRQHLQVYTRDGVEIAQFGSERRIFVPIEKVPERLKRAVLAIEDTDFYSHGGISWRGLARAAVSNLTGGVGGGASTITQQVARTFFLSMRRTPERKIKEALLAWQIEHELSKDRILELYLNQIYLGQRSYGFAAAAQTYFGKTLDQLTLAETTLLAGLPQNPIHANPAADMERARRRGNVVLQRMTVLGQINDAQRDAARAERLTLRDPRGNVVNAEHLAEMARQAVFERLGERAYTEGIRVVTSIVADDQRAAHAALRRAVLAHERRQAWRGPEDQEKLPDASDKAASERAAAQVLRDQRDDDDLRIALVLSATPREVVVQLASGETVTLRGDGLRLVQAALAPNAREALALRRGSLIRVMQAAGAKPGAGWSVVQWPQAEGAFVALDPATGRVRAIVGGFDFGKTQFNRVTQAWRQPGSSFKPFLYSAALEHGVMPETRVDDLPLTNPDGSPADWNPSNSDNRFDGEMSLRDGLVKSKNLVSVRVLQQVGLPAAREWISHFGLDPAKHPQDLTFALGSGSVTPMQMATAYAVFANGGHQVTPVLIERITDAKGQVLFAAPPAPALSEDNRVLPARNAFLVNTLLADVTRRGTAALAQGQLRRSDLYGKTGTTNDAVDAWFAGFQPSLVAVAWIGHDDPRSLGERESGGGLALPMWIEAMGRFLRKVPVAPLTPPDGIVAAGNDWRYAEYADGGFLARIGSPRPAEDESAAAPGAAAAGTANATHAVGTPPNAPTGPNGAIVSNGTMSPMSSMSSGPAPAAAVTSNSATTATNTANTSAVLSTEPPGGPPR